MQHLQISQTLSRTTRKEIRYAGSDMATTVAISLLYTTLMVILVKLKIIRPVQAYLN